MTTPYRIPRTVDGCTWEARLETASGVPIVATGRTRTACLENLEMLKVMFS